MGHKRECDHVDGLPRARPVYLRLYVLP
jgi:hypothetical protein